MKSIKVSEEVYEKLIKLRAKEELKKGKRVTLSEILNELLKIS